MSWIHFSTACLPLKRLAAQDRAQELHGTQKADTILPSLLTTDRDRRESLLNALRSIAGPSPLQAAGLA